MTLVRAVGVRKSFGSTPAAGGGNRIQVLRDFNLTVAAGQVVCLLGPSGAGKSTFLRCVNHLETIDAGRIWVDGEPVGFTARGGKLFELREREVARQRRGVGMVFQRFNLFPHRTAVENVAEGPVHVLRTPRKAAVDEARALLDRVGLADKADSYPHQLSGGQQQRVAIARALAMRPKLMLFDEPTSALDPELVGEVLDVMADLARDGMTMIVVTHEIGFARQVADSVVFMVDGAVVETGPPGQVLDNPRQQRTQQFLAKVL